MSNDVGIKVVERETAKSGMRGKINAKCCDCIYDGAEHGSWRQQVEACTASDCPLYTVRPKAVKA